MKKEDMKKQFWSSLGAAIQSALSPLSTQQSPSGLRLICNARFLAIAQRFLTNLHHTGLTAPLELFPTLRPRSSQTNLPCLTLDPRVKSENDRKWEWVKPENDVIKKVPENDSAGEYLVENDRGEEGRMPEGEGMDSRVKPENDVIKKVPENDNMGRLGGGNMKRIFSATVLTLCSVFLFSSMANAACSPVDCAALGYTKTEAACNGSSTIRCPFDVTKVNCVEIALSCAVGDIYYSDGTCDANVIPGKTPVGVVGYLTDGGKHGAVIALEEKSLKWGYSKDLGCLPNYTDSDGVSSDLNGVQNTECIIQGGSNPAAEYCYGYSPVSNGKGSTGWYLPAAGELLMVSLPRMNNALQLLSKNKLEANFYWSSSEYGLEGIYYFAWLVNLSDGNLTQYFKHLQDYPVRCMLEF